MQKVKICSGFLSLYGKFLESLCVIQSLLLGFFTSLSAHCPTPWLEFLFPSICPNNILDIDAEMPDADAECRGLQMASHRSADLKNNENQAKGTKEMAICNPRHSASGIGIRHPAFGISASISSMLVIQIDRTENSIQGVGQ